MGALVPVLVNIFSEILCSMFTLSCPNEFNIELLNVGTDGRYDRLFERAARRWEEIIVRDLEPIRNPTVDLFVGFFPENAVIRPVDDILIGYQITDIPLNLILGITGPLRIRADGTPYSAGMRLDRTFLDGNSDETNYAIILKEMGHALGVGTLWFECAGGCVAGAFTVDFPYTCSNAFSEHSNLNLMNEEGEEPLLRVASRLDSGLCRNFADDSFPTDDAWDELYTPTMIEGVAQLITRVTIGSLQDVSSAYVVNYDAADPIPDPMDTSSTNTTRVSGIIVDRTISVGTELPPTVVFDEE